MSSYKSKSATLDEINKWSKNKLINPRTKRKIKKTSPIYKYLNNQYNMIKDTIDDKKEDEDVIIDEKSDTSNEMDHDSKIDVKLILNKVQNYLGPANGDHLLSCDNKDPITQEDIWIREDGVKIKSDEIPSYKLFSYSDTDNIIRCFNIETIINMINNDCIAHPITGIDMDIESIKRATEMYKILKDNNVINEKSDDRSEEEKVNSYAFDVFQKFSIISIFIDHQWFIKLNKKDLEKLNYELQDFYDQNVTEENKLLMVPPEGKAFAITKSEFSSKYNELEMKKYLLENIDKVISSSEDESMKTLGSYIMIGGLAVVCKEIRERYPDFVYGFSLD